MNELQITEPALPIELPIIEPTFLPSTHSHQYCTPIPQLNPRVVKTTKMETKMVPMDHFVMKKVKKVVRQLVMKKKLQRIFNVLMVDREISEWQTMVPSDPTDVEFNSVNIPNTRETTCALRVP